MEKIRTLFKEIISDQSLDYYYVVIPKPLFRTKLCIWFSSLQFSLPAEDCHFKHTWPSDVDIHAVVFYLSLRRSSNGCNAKVSCIQMLLCPFPLIGVVAQVKHGLLFKLPKAPAVWVLRVPFILIVVHQVDVRVLHGPVEKQPSG